MDLFFGFDLQLFIRTVGYLGLFGIVFAESGLFIGFFLPGDSLLFTAGFLASQGYFHIALLVLLSFIGATLGDNVGYAFGRRVGMKIFTKEDSFFFHKDHLLRAKRFYETHGGKALVLARFMPVVRTFAPILAGVGEMRYGTFFFYNIIGAALWGMGLPLLGYFLGSTLPGIDRYLFPIIAAIVFFSILPTGIHLLKNKTYRDQLMGLWKR